VLPTAHYAMGGIPTDVHGRVIMDGKGTIVDGLYAAGECACVSVHGANRLGTNSLLDLVVFGRRAGQHIGDYVKQADMPQWDATAADEARPLSVASPTAQSGPHGGHITEEMQTVMMEKVGIYRNSRVCRRPWTHQAAAAALPVRARVQDTGKQFNTDLLEIIELGNLLDLSLMTAASALNRQESRGAHSREDFPERDDDNWLKHTLAYLEAIRCGIDYKAVDTSIWEPKPRTY
jgi:succinate dehydrogenase / fumarate reductase flavoprotein subunit